MPRTRGPRRNLLPLAAVIAAAAAIFAAVALWSWAGSTLRTIQREDPRQVVQGAQGAQLPAGLRQPFNVLLIGVDRRQNPEEGVRSDTLILLHVDPAANWAGMLSIPRDSVATIPNYGQSKINFAYTYGYTNAEALYGAGTSQDAAGGALAAETVAAFLGVKVDYIAQVDFDGFRQVVDTLGGITLDVERPILDPSYPTEDYGYERLFIPAGLQTMDGTTALRYARTRHSSSDFDRSARQQQVLRAILNRAKSQGLLDQVAALPGLVQDLERNVSTTMPLTDLDTLTGLAALARTMDPGRILTLSINPNDVGVLREVGSDIYWNEGDVRAQVARLLAGPQASSEPAARIQVLNGAGRPGLAGRVSGALAGRGFTVNTPGDAPGPVERTMLVDYSGRPEALKQLAAELGLDPAAVYATPPADAPPAPYQTDIAVILGADFNPAWPGQ